MATWQQVVVDILLGLAIALQLVCALGLLLMPHVYDRVHFLGPATTIAPVLVAAAVVTVEAFDHQGIESVLLALFLAVLGPVLSHATVRAARIREHGDWHAGPDESVRRPGEPARAGRP